MIKAKEEWLGVYFFNVKPWSPSLVNLKRELWVKVYGIPLHAWGDNLFRALGERFGEFVDYDEPTASMSRLDVARLKFSTSIRIRIEAPVVLVVMGVSFEVWVVEEEVGKREVVEEYGEIRGDQSWGGSSGFPRNTAVACGDELNYGEEEEDDDVVSIDSPTCQLERDNAQLLARRGHTFPMTSNHSPNNLVFCNFKGGEGHVSEETVEREEGAARGKQVVVGEEPRVAVFETSETDGDVDRLVEPSLLGKEGGSGIGPSGLEILIQNEEAEGCVEDVLLEEDLGPYPSGPVQCVEGVSEAGCLHGDGSGRIQAQPISCSPPCDTEVLSKQLQILPVTVNETTMRLSNLSEDQSLRQTGDDNIPHVPVAKKLGNRSKFPFGCGPKFLQLVEAVKDGGGGGRRRRARGGGEVGRSSSVPVLQGGRERSTVGVLTTTENVAEAVPLISTQIEGLNLEVVLPGPFSPLLAGSISQGSEELSVVPESPLGPVVTNSQLIREATSILSIQKQVGFSFTMDDNTVIDNLVAEEVKDRAVMREREDDIGDQ
jgi:hypothetical protein